MRPPVESLPALTDHWAPFVAAALALAVTLAPVPSLAAASAEEIETAVEKVLAGGDYQRELPLPKPSGGAGNGERGEGLWSEPDWWRDEGDSQAQDFYHPAPQEVEDPGWDFDLPPGLVEVLRLLMWIVLLAGGALLAYYLMNHARLFSRRKKDDWQEPQAGAAAAGGRREARLEDYDRLAAEGDYAAAIHALLLHCIAGLRRRGAILSSAMTSREILRRLQLGDGEREALSTLVRMAEVTHFGGRAASDAEFRQCRELFDRILPGEPA